MVEGPVPYSRRRLRTPGRRPHASWRGGYGSWYRNSAALFSGIGVVLEPVDWILTLHDLSQGQYAAAIAFLPFVPEGVNFILRRSVSSGAPWPPTRGIQLHSASRMPHPGRLQWYASVLKGRSTCIVSR
jgi:hypothetical protein